MKKQIVFILVSAFAAAFTSCNNDDNGRDNVGFSPKSDQQMTVGPEAGTHTIYYDIASPTGASVAAEVSPNVDWIEEVNTTSAYGARMERSISPCPSTVAMSPELRILF